MGNVGNWVMGACATILALGGLFVAARAGHGVGYYGGLAVFLFCTMFVGYLIKSSTEAH